MGHWPFEGQNRAGPKDVNGSDRLKIGSRKPELRTNTYLLARKRSTRSWAPRSERPQQIPDPQAKFSETSGVRKYSRDHWQIPDISDPQVDVESVDLQAKPRNHRRIPETYRFPRPQTLRQLRNHRLIGQIPLRPQQLANTTSS